MQTKLTSSLLIFAIPLVVGLMATPSAAKTVDASKGNGKIQITWLGHAAFEVVSPKGTRFLLDPFLTKNPKTPSKFKVLSRYKPDAVLVTHSHGDHVGDAVAIAKQANAPIIGAHDHVKTMNSLPKNLARGGNVGGTFQINDVTVHLVPAMHGSTPGGRPIGFVLTFDDGRSLYHSGDTWIFTDMGLIQELYHPDILLLQAGGGPYNQAPDVAALAVKKFFSPKVIIPMHFGTFGVLATDADVDKAFADDKRYRRMQPGESASF